MSTKIPTIVQDDLNSISYRLKYNWYTTSYRVNEILSHIVFNRYRLTIANKIIKFHKNKFTIMYDFIKAKREELEENYPSSLEPEHFDLNHPDSEQFYLNCIKYIEFIRLSNNVSIFVKPSFDFDWGVKDIKNNVDRQEYEKELVNERKKFKDKLNTWNDEEEKYIKDIISLKETIEDQSKTIDRLLKENREYLNEKNKFRNALISIRNFVDEKVDN